MFKKRKKMSKEEVNENETENVQDEAVETVENEEINTEETTQEELSPLELKEIEYKELNDKYIRLFSEFDNFRKRTAKEKIELRMTAGSDVIKELLPILDDFDRAAKFNNESDDITAIKEGFNLIHNKIDKNLAAKGLKQMVAAEQTFDVSFHEALTQIPAPTEALKGKVVDVIEKGYLLNDKVIRFAKVVVGQ